MSNLKDSVKIVILGPPGIGKTTLRKIFFDQENPFELVQQTLEPTINVDINTYSFDTNISVHDLAGQQLEEWLNESQEIFIGSDLIICVLDCRDPWDKNFSLWKRIDEIQHNLCPDAEILFLFHKIDLISEDAQDALRDQIWDALPEYPKVFYCLTSIFPKYYLKTLRIFMFMLQKYQNPSQLMQVNENLFKIEILDMIAKSPLIPVMNLYSSLKIPLFNFRALIEKLIKNQFLLQDPSTNALILAESGRNAIDEFKSNILENIGDYLETQYYFFNDAVQKVKF
jgi:GTPase SAR1 family protein